MKLSVIVPVYNEEKTVARVLEKILAVTLPESLQKEILVIDDGSDDETPRILQQFSAAAEIQVHSFAQNRGKTSAVKEGLTRATGDMVVIQDADLEYDPASYLPLLEPMLHDGADVVYGSRFLGSIRGMTRVNRWANRISNITINALYGTHLTDFHTCLKLFKRCVLDQLDIRSERFCFDTEVTCKTLKLGYKITERPIAYCARTRAEGKKITWKQALETYLTLLKCRFVDR